MYVLKVILTYLECRKDDKESLYFKGGVVAPPPPIFVRKGFSSPNISEHGAKYYLKFQKEHNAPRKFLLFDELAPPPSPQYKTSSAAKYLTMTDPQN